MISLTFKTCKAIVPVGYIYSVFIVTSLLGTIRVVHEDESGTRYRKHKIYSISSDFQLRVNLDNFQLRAILNTNSQIFLCDLTKYLQVANVK